MPILLVPGFMADETLWRDLEAPLARFAPERVRAVGMRLRGEVFRRQSMLERPGYQAP
jgi:pimeloyl-ACP methyl ester carboxylesterase